MYTFTYNARKEIQRYTRNVTLPLIGPSAASLANPVKSLPEYPSVKIAISFNSSANTKIYLEASCSLSLRSLNNESTSSMKMTEG
ncbi:hypothetical protein PUN28_003081 [Cardiocondyla obscurior]|uniref:Uncharacterized protein n=1 Tax=Cardiocondyla obscurior TaxID=286306 RepID=A0AAW2GL16_9HYME